MFTEWQLPLSVVSVIKLQMSSIKKAVKYVTTIFLLFCSITAKCQIKITADSSVVGTYNPIELTISHPFSYNNNWEDVAVSAVFTCTKTITIDGFYYNTNTWKVRFAPPDIGKWSYKITFNTPTGSFVDTGSFSCIQSTTKGFLKRHPNNPFRLIFADGTLFNSIGLEDCIQDYNGNGTPLDDWGFDGGLITDTYKGSLTNLQTYMTAYGEKGAGFNLYRWTTDNCSFKLYNTITAGANTYLVNEGMFGDTLVRSLRANKIRIWLTFFGPPVFNNIDGSTPLEEAAIKKYIRYVMARYGAYVDIWELFNESSASNYYYSTITSYIRSIDPYNRLISVSDERPALSAIDINSPHWYEKESELQSDARAAAMINQRKLYNKPIIFGEQGNSVQNWDTLSAVRLRLRAWTSFFSEGTLIFWNTSFSKSYMQPISANIYLGPIERSYIKNLQSFTALADSATTIFKIVPANADAVRAYGLGSSNRLFGYFHHYSSHANTVNTSFIMRVKRSATVYWINPATGAIISSSNLSYGTQSITSPGFNIDIAMQIVLDSGFTSSDLNKKLEILVYPNPASQVIAFDGNFNGTATMELYSMSGKRLFTWKNLLNDQKVNISSLPNGVYIYRITTGDRQTAGKVIINN